MVSPPRFGEWWWHIETLKCVAAVDVGNDTTVVVDEVSVVDDEVIFGSIEVTTVAAVTVAWVFPATLITPIEFRRLDALVVDATDASDSWILNESWTAADFTIVCWMREFISIAGHATSETLCHKMVLIWFLCLYLLSLLRCVSFCGRDDEWIDEIDDRLEATESGADDAMEVEEEEVLWDNDCFGPSSSTSSSSPKSTDDALHSESGWILWWIDLSQPHPQQRLSEQWHVEQQLHDDGLVEHVAE